MISIPRILFASLLGAASAVPAYVGQWRHYSDKSRVNALIVHKGYVYAGTEGGVRRIDATTSAQKDFGNPEGLIDPWIQSFAVDTTGTLWAVSLDGFLYALAAGGARWDVHGRSYPADLWSMNPRAVLAAGTHLYLGSSKGLAVFDTDSKLSQLNLERFGNDMNVPVLSLLRRSDTLYVGTTAGVYKARVFFADPLNPDSGYANIADHNQWTKVTLPSIPGRQYNHLAFIGDSLATYGPGTLLQADAVLGASGVRVDAFDGSPLRIGTQIYPGSYSDYTSAVRAAGKVFVGGSSGLSISANPGNSALDAAMLAQLRTHSRDSIGNVAANGGRVWGYSASGAWAFDPTTETFGSLQPIGGEGTAVISRSLRNIRVDANGDVYLGTWGEGVNRLRDNQKTVFKADPAGSNCIYQAFPPNDPWTVVFSLSQPRNTGLYHGFYFTIFRTENAGDHQLVHFNTETEAITCVANSVTGGYPHAVLAFSDSLLGVATNAGLALFKTREGPTAPQLESEGNWTVAGGANEAFDLAVDGYSRPWITMGGGLARLDLDSVGVSTTHRLVTPETFAGTGCRSLESDPAGALWVGCENGLFHVKTDAFGGIAASRKYGIDNGLPSLVLYDVSVDPSDGKVWVATDRGVAVLESSSQPPIAREDLAVVVPYPNPFRPQHAFVVFNKLPVNSTLRLHDPSGRVVRTFRPGDLTGNEAHWDGTNEQGKKVAPGVYLFSVTSGSKVQRGKVIVAR
jgi:hypothetical protein